MKPVNAEYFLLVSAENVIGMLSVHVARLLRNLSLKDVKKLKSNSVDNKA